MRRNYYVLLFLCFSLQSCYSQLGLSFGRITFDAKGWENNFERRSVLINPYPMVGWQIAADYHLFGAKRKRIEFIPSISFSKFKYKKGTLETNLSTAEKLEHQHLKFQVNTRFYILDMNCDFNCDSLTSKEGFFKKGFFIETSPILLLKFNYQYYETNASLFGWHNSKSTTVGAMIGLGMDLPIFKKWTVTPVYQFHYFPWNSNWSNGTRLPLNITSDLKQHFVGCRIQVEL